MESRPITFVVVNFVNFFYIGKDVNGIFCIPQWKHREQLAQMHAEKGGNQVTNSGRGQRNEHSTECGLKQERCLPVNQHLDNFAN